MTQPQASTLRKAILGIATVLGVTACASISSVASACPSAARVHNRPHAQVRVLLPVSDADRLEAEVLVLTNAYRARGATCGDRSYGPAAPLVFDPSLQRAARAHSQDMGARNYFAHASLDGRTPGDRMRAAGFTRGFVGENIFGGPRTAREVVDGWMKSPGHCQNIMNPGYHALGVGYARVPGSSLEHYWTQDFGG